MYRMAEAKEDFDDGFESPPMDDSEVVHDPLKTCYECVRCFRKHPCEWDCRGCGYQQDWHSCCACCDPVGGVACEKCTEDWLYMRDSGIECDSDAETQPYDDDD